MHLFVHVDLAKQIYNQQRNLMRNMTGPSSTTHCVVETEGSLVEEPRSSTNKPARVTFECHSHQMLEAIFAMSSEVPESHNPQDDAVTPKPPAIPLRGETRLHSRTVEGENHRLSSPSIVESALASLTVESNGRSHGSPTCTNVVTLVDEFILWRNGRVPRAKRSLGD